MTNDRVGALAFAIAYFCALAAATSVFAEQVIRASHVDPIIFVIGWWGAIIFAAILLLIPLFIVPMFIVMFGLAVAEAAIRLMAGAHLWLEMVALNLGFALFIVVISQIAHANARFTRAEDWFPAWHKPRKRRS